MTLVQARIPISDVRQVDEDAAILGLKSRSAAIREALRLLHRHAREVALSHEYDVFYGNGEAPVGDISTIGDQIAAEAVASRKAGL